MRRRARRIRVRKWYSPKQIQLNRVGKALLLYSCLISCRSAVYLSRGRLTARDGWAKGRSTRHDNSRQLGRAILQLVGNIVFWVPILLTTRQPQPVPSSSKVSLPEIGPSDAMYMGWKNW